MWLHVSPFFCFKKLLKNSEQVSIGDFGSGLLYGCLAVAPWWPLLA